MGLLVAVSKEVAEGMLVRTLDIDGISVSTDAAASVTVVPGGEGPDGAEEIKMTRW